MPDSIVVTKQLLEKTFDEAAPSYDSIWFLRDCGQRLVNIMPINLGDRVLDVATGTGLVLLPAARKVGPKGHVTGIDISNSMLIQAKQAVDESGFHNIDLLKMDAEHLEFPDASFDAITCGFGIFFFPPNALLEMYRVCKPGATIGVTVFERTTPDVGSPLQILFQVIKDFGIELKWSWPTQYSTDEVESLLASHGFAHVGTFQEKTERVIPDLEEFWESSVLSSATRMVVTNMDEATRGRFKEGLLSRLRGVMQPDGLHYLNRVVYALAQK